MGIMQALCFSTCAYTSNDSNDTEFLDMKFFEMMQNPTYIFLEKVCEHNYTN